MVKNCLVPGCIRKGDFISDGKNSCIQTAKGPRRTFALAENHPL